MIVVHSKRAVFIAVGKTGSYSIWRHLLDRYGAELHGEYHSTAIPTKWRDYFTFATVRNPFARFVSLYRYVKGKRTNRMHGVANRLNFRQFVRWHMAPERDAWCERVPTQAEFLRGIRLDALLRTETLQTDFSALPFLKPPTTLERWHDSRKPRKSWRKAYDHATAEIIREWAAEDFERYGYDRGDP